MYTSYQIIHHYLHGSLATFIEPSVLNNVEGDSQTTAVPFESIQCVST